VYGRFLSGSVRSASVDINFMEYYVRSYIKGKKIHLRTGHEGPEWKQRYRPTLSLTSLLDTVEGQRHTPAAVLSGKRPNIHFIGGVAGQVRKISPPTGIQSSGRPACSESRYRLRYPGP
jgi:hypothetical protein